MGPESRDLELSLVIPLYNASATIGAVVDEIHAVSSQVRFEIVLVDDGSADATEQICRDLMQRYPDTIVLLRLSRNFGEFAAVMAGIQHAAGSFVVTMDDDGQHPPAEAMRLYQAIRLRGDDVVYGRYRTKEHGPLRNLASWSYNLLATILLGKPADLYLSSFKIMNQFVIDAIKSQQNTPSYIDGLICRTTQRVSQLEVEHRPRLDGRSNYTLRRLAYTWASSILSFSVLPLRAASLLGLVCSMLSAPLLVFLIIDTVWITPDVTFGIPTVACLMVFFASVQLLVLGVFGEYLSRLYVSGSPPYVVREHHGPIRNDKVHPKQRLNASALPPPAAPPFR
ncbi:MAG TPA: glycosyltransferase family 2 protein [Terriglobales bacterium]|nr:glycosyltransferase family 2 protein [Terriglobales bacterium]